MTATLKPETIEFLQKRAGLAYNPGQRTLIRGSNRRRGYMGRARLYANRTHGGYAKARDTSGAQHAKRMMAGYQTHSEAARNKQDLISRIHAFAPHLLQHTPELHAATQKHIKSAQAYARLAAVRKVRNVRMQVRDPSGKWTGHAQRGEFKGLNDKVARADALRYDHQHGELSHIGGGDFFQRILRAASKVKKDLTAGDVHVAGAIGGDRPRRKAKKYPPLSFAYGESK